MADDLTRFAMRVSNHPEAAERLAAQAREEADRRFKAYHALAAGQNADTREGA